MELYKKYLEEGKRPTKAVKLARETFKNDGQ